MLDSNKLHGSRRDFHMSNKALNTDAMHSHGSETSASCVLHTGSEPSGSNRTSLEVSAPSSATATIASSRKSVSFEQTRLTPSSSREDFGLSQSSPFSSYANLGSFEDYRRSSDEGVGVGAGRFTKGNAHQKSNQTEHQCMLGVDSQATSAPMGTLDDVSAAAAAIERLSILRNANNNNTGSNLMSGGGNNGGGGGGSQQQSQTAAQRLRNQSSGQINNGGFIPVHSSMERKSSLPLPTSNEKEEQQEDAGAATAAASSPPPPAPSPDLLRDFGEAYGAHLVSPSPRHSLDHSSVSLSSSSSLAQLHHQHSNRNSIGGGSNSGGGNGNGSVHHSHSNNSIAPPTSRSSLDVLLGASAGSTPSRHSLDSLQDLLAAVGGVGGGGGVGRASWESLGGTPRSSGANGVKSTTGFNLGNVKASHRLSAAGHLENARLAMASSSLSLDPLTEKNLIDDALNPHPFTSAASASASTATMEHRYPSTSEILSPSALRALADSSMSVTVVAAPTKRSAPTAAGPSVGAMASGLIDHYIPVTGESSTPPRNAAGGLGGSASLNIADPATGTATGGTFSPRTTTSIGSATASTSINTGRSQPRGYMPSGHVAPPALLDADLHDTFGAHAWYCGPAIIPSNKNNNRNSFTNRRDSNGGFGGGSYANSKFNARSSTEMNRDGMRASIENNGNFRAGGGDGVVPGSAGTSGKQFSGGLAASVAANDSASAYSAAGTVSAGQQQQQQRHLGGNRGTAKHLELTSMPGQHSVTLHDAQCIVPSYDFLRQRRVAKAQAAEEGDAYWSGGYIAEAKRVLNEAMGTASRQEAENRDSSYSGAIGPLLRHLNAAAGDNEKSRSALHTLGLLVSNLPNRGIIAELQGRHTLAAVLRRSTALDVREQAVTLLWDLDSAAGKDAGSVFTAEDLFALIQLLKDTQHAAVASSALHFLDAAIELPAEVGERVVLSTEQLSEMSMRVVSEVCAHKHRLQDAAQYTLGALLGALLNDPLMTQQAVSEALESLLSAVRICKDADQCQVLLTVLSSLAGKPRLLSLLAKGTHARDAVLQCGQNAGDQRVRARSLSLIKVLRSKDELPTAAALSSSWYFGPEDSTATPAIVLE
jgi:hypothetical protein